MDAVTYPQRNVIRFIEENIIPLRVPSDSQPLSAEFNIKWTPALITLDAEGKEHHRTVGFLSAEELVAALELGIGKVFFDLDQHQEALDALSRLLAEYPKSDSVAEAIYLAGVSRYKSTGDPKPLKEAYEKLNSEYPASEWTRRAYPYRLL